MKQLSDNRQVLPARIAIRGVIAGFTATIPMTIFMLATQRFLPKGQRYELPPELIIKDIAHKAHIRWRMKKQHILGATLFSHFGYGAAMGTLYMPLRNIPLPAAIRGVLFGLAVWATSYLCLLPLLHISESGHREPATRNFMLIAAHVIWGFVLGIVADAPPQRK